MVLVGFTNGPSCICNVSAFAVAAPDAVLSKMHQTSSAADPRIAAAKVERKAESYAE
jgi:hypothetical protein